MIGAAGNSAGAGSGVSIIGGEAETAQYTWQHAVVLQVSGFKAADPGASRVHRLGGEVIAKRAAGRLVVHQLKRLGDDRILQRLVEIPHRDRAECLQVMIEEEIDVVAD